MKIFNSTQILRLETLSQRSAKVALSFSVAVLFFAITGCAPKMLPVPKDIPLAEFSNPINSVRSTLPSGLTVHLVENHELPIVSGTLTIRGGTLLDTQIGLTSAMADQMRAGGAGNLTGAELDTELQRLAASVSSGAGPESISISFSCLAADLERVMQLFSTVVLHPRFEEQRFSLWRSQALEGIRRRSDDPWTVAGIGFQELVFGAGAKAPYGRVSTSTDIKALRRSSLVAMHQKAITPHGSYFAISGAVNQARVFELLAKYFPAWNSPEAKMHQEVKSANRDTKLPALNFNPKPGIYFIELPLSQASVYIGQQGVARLTPDYPAIDVFNQIFGSGFFGSRLMKTVRTDRGLVYGIFGGVTSGPVRGKAAIAFQTKSESVNEAIDASMSELLLLRSDLASEQELRETQSAVSNAFVFRFDSIDEVVQRAVTLEFLNYPADYDATYLTKIAAVKPEDVREVARSRWDLNKLVVLVVGNKSIWPKLAQLKENPTLKNLAVTKLSFNEVLR